MKITPSATQRRAFAAAAALTIAGAAGAGILKPDVYIYADENGNATIDFVDESLRGGGTLDWGLVPDFGPGGLEEVLFYDMGGPPDLLFGDVIIYDPDTKEISDLIRFAAFDIPAARGEGPPPGILGFYFYSDLPEMGETPSLADVGIPDSFNENALSFPELEIPGLPGSEGLVYIPGPNDPGFVPGFIIQYTFVSDIPAPGSAALLGLTGLAALRRRRR